MKKFLLGTYDFFHLRKGLFYTITIGITLLLAALASRVHIEEDISRMMPNGEQMKQVNNIFRHSHFYDRIIIKIKGSDTTQPEQLIALADTLESRLQGKYSHYISDFKVRVSDETAFDIYNTVHNNLPVYLDAADYARIDSLIAPKQVSETLQSDYNTLTSASGLILKRIIADDPVGITTLALRKLQSLQVDDKFELYDGYIVSKDHHGLYMFITPTHSSGETKENAALLDGLDEVIGSLKAQESGAEVLYYGGIPVAVGNARQLKKDTILTLSITVVAIVLFIGFFFRRKRVPFIMLLPVVFGGLFSIAIIAVTKGSISSIALGAGSIVLGIAINYSLHFFSHYKHCGSIKETLSDLLAPMTIGSFTTVGSFFSLTLLQSQILNDFGLFAGWSLVGATIFTLFFLPHFTPLQQEHSAEVAHESWLEKMLSYKLKYKGAVFALILVLTVFFYHYAQRVTFQSDMNQFNFMDAKTQKAEKEIDWMQNDTSKTVFIASTGSNAEDMFQNNEELLKQLDEAEQKGWVKKYSSISKFMPSGKLQREKLERWNAYWTTDKKQKLLALLQTEGKKVGFSATAFNRFESLLNKDYTVATQEDFEAIRSSFGSEYLITGGGMNTVVNAVTVDKAHRKALYAMLGTSKTTVILDKQVITNSLIDVIYHDFNSVLLYTSLLVFFALLLSYGRLELTIITFLPMLITWIWILGIMALLGLQFNIINIIISTFIFGLGDDFSIFITDGLMRKFRDGKEVLASHKVSILLSAITITIGLGALIFAQHLALRSIALISIIGIFCVLFIGQTVQPFLYNFFIQSRKEKGFAPWTISTLLLFWIAFGYYVTVSLTGAVVGYILIYLVPYPNLKKRKLFFHYLVCYALRILTYMMVNVRKRHEGKENVDFSKPAVIIANHASFLDILVTVMQHPKLILLTNKWVYYSPVFGKAVQLADYYPVMEGVDPGIQKFVDIVKDGYSIVVFPEGTRSADGKLNRFHKGAFYLAEQLNIDIIPMLLHGTGDTIRKGDFMVMNSFMTMKFLPRIRPNDKTFGEGYAERTKRISRYFKMEFEKLRAENEIPRYFRQRFILNYLYKGPELEWKAKWIVRKEEYFSALHAMLPKTGTVTELGCGYGFTTYMMHFLGDERAITAVDMNEEKIEVAENCYSKNDRLRFICADVTQMTFETQDAFIVNKLLNSLSENQQKDLVQQLLNALPPSGVLMIISEKKKMPTVSTNEINKLVEQAGKQLQVSETQGMMLWNIQ